MINANSSQMRAGNTPDKYGACCFVRLPEVEPAAILAHLRDPRIARHLPLLPAEPDMALVEKIIAAKEACWEGDGLGHWAILHDGEYAGWGGFQREGNEWDFGLVLRPAYFRHGKAIAIQVFEWARRHTNIEEVTFLLPLSRSERALQRFGARPMGTSEHAGLPFRKWSLSFGVVGRRDIGASDRIGKGRVQGCVASALGSGMHSRTTATSSQQS